MNSKFINGCKRQISAIHSNIAKEKITSASPQLALPYLLPILQPLWLNSARSRCNKQVTKKNEWIQEDKKDGFKCVLNVFVLVWFCFLSQTLLHLQWHLSSWEQHDWTQFSWNMCPLALSLKILLEMHLPSLLKNFYRSSFDFTPAQKQEHSWRWHWWIHIAQRAALCCQTSTRTGHDSSDAALGRFPANRNLSSAAPCASTQAGEWPRPTAEGWWDPQG